MFQACIDSVYCDVDRLFVCAAWMLCDATESNETEGTRPEGRHESPCWICDWSANY